MIDAVSELRSDFPVLKRQVGETPLVYLDNAATTQTPRDVYEVYEEFYTGYNANVHRGIHTLSHEASAAYEAAHDRVADFIGADGREEIVFTKNTTEGLNLVAYGLGLTELGPDDAIVTTKMEHHASLVPWQQIAARTGANLRYIGLTDDGRLDLTHAADLITSEVAVVSLVHVSNVLGTVNPVAEIADLAHEQDAHVVVDGAQSVPVRPVDVGRLDVDFLSFSGHKMAGPTGIGVLYGKQHLLEEMEPFLFGGEMIKHVTLTDSSWNELPWKFEAGTPPIAEGIALGAAVDYLTDIGMDRVQEHEAELAQYLLERLEAREDVTTYGPPAGEERAGLVAFNVDGVHGHDLSEILDDRGIAVRAGDHCTQPLHELLDVPGSVRASFYVYNTTDEVDRLIDAIDGAERKLVDLLGSDRYHASVLDHYREPRGDEVTDPTIVESAEETTCGDDGEFRVRVDADGTIAALGFRSESCAVSSAVASILSEHFVGLSIDEVAGIENRIVALLEGEFSDLRHDCVVGPEQVLVEAARGHLDAVPGTDVSD